MLKYYLFETICLIVICSIVICLIVICLIVICLIVICSIVICLIVKILTKHYFKKIDITNNNNNNYIMSKSKTAKQLAKIINTDNDLNSSLPKFSEKEILALIKYLADKYYNEEHIVSDEIYDKIVEYYEKTFDKIIGIGAKVDENEVKLPIYMNSLDKIKTIKEIELFKSRNDFNKTNNNNTYFITVKLDGVSCLLQKLDNIIKLYTRGDGEYGKDVSHLLPLINLNTTKLTEQNIMIRGELLITRSDYEIANADDSYTHPRNFVISMVNSKTIDENLMKFITFVPYFVIIDNIVSMKKSEQIEFLKTKDFKYNIASKITNNLKFDELLEFYTEQTKNNEFVLDGLVITNDEAIFPITVSKEKFPKHEIAFKHNFEENIEETTVIEVRWNISKNGLLKPTVYFKPVIIMGYEVKKATGNNAKYILDNMINVGSVINVTLANNVIPHIENVVNNDNVKNSAIPVNVIWIGVDIKPIDSSSEQKENILTKQLVYFFDTLDVGFLKGKTIEKIIENMKERFGDEILNFNNIIPLNNNEKTKIINNNNQNNNEQIKIINNNQNNNEQTKIINNNNNNNNNNQNNNNNNNNNQNNNNNNNQNNTNNNTNALFKILSYTISDFIKIDGFKKDKSEKIFNELSQKVNMVELAKLMDASQFFKRIGTKKLRLLLEVYPNFLQTIEEKKLNETELLTLLNEIKGYEMITSKAILENINDFINWLKELKKIRPNIVFGKALNINNNLVGDALDDIIELHLVKKIMIDEEQNVNKKSIANNKETIDKNKETIDNNKEPIANNNNEFTQFKNKKIVFSGVRLDKIAESKIEKAGGKIMTSVSKTTDLLVMKDVSEESGKKKDAIANGVKIISMDEFYEMIIEKMTEVRPIGYGL